MKFGKYLMNSMNILNLFLLVGVGGFFFCIIGPLLGAPQSVNIPASREISPVASPAGFDVAENTQIPDYVVIGELNLFHPNRTIPPEKPEKKDALLTPKPELVLYGTLITNGLKIAFVQDKKAAPSTPERGSRQTALKEGQTVSGYTLKMITEKTIVLANGDDQITLYLDELKDRKGETTGAGRAPAAVQTIQPAQRMSKTPYLPAIPPLAPRAPLSQSPSSTPAVQAETSSAATPPFPPVAVVPMPSSHLIKRPSR